MKVDINTDEILPEVHELDALPRPTKLFVYGIFLGESNREHYGLKNPRYNVVSNFFTVGDTIVRAKYIEQSAIGLTGLLCDEPESWVNIDGLEAGYERIIVETNMGERAYMYVEPGTAELLGQMNHSTYVRQWTKVRK